MRLLFTGAFPALLFCADSGEQKGISVAAFRPAACATARAGSDAQSLAFAFLPSRACLCHPFGSLLLTLPARLSLTNAFLISLTGNWITTRSAVLRMGHLGLCVTWKCCKYSLYLWLVARARCLGSTNVAAYLRAAAWCQDGLVKKCLKIIHCDVL